MKTFLRQYSKPVVSILLVLVLMASTLVTGVIATGEYKETVNKNNTEATAVSAAESKTTSVEPDADNSTDKAVKNTAGSSINKKKDKKRTGATAKNRTGYDTWYVRGSWDTDSNGAWRDHNITSSSDYSVTLEANTDYQFVFKANNDQFSSNTTISGTTDYTFPKNSSSSITLHTTIAGTYTFKYKGMEGGSTAMQTRIEFPVDNTPDTWTVVGGTGGNTNGDQSDDLFTTTWNVTLTQNDMTNTSGTTWTWSKNNVTLPAGKILCKVVKNHSYDTAYPAGQNKESADLAAGEYNVTITFDSNTKEVTITATLVAKSTLSVANIIEHTDAVTATYNGATAGKGQSISNIPEGAAVTITVTPSTGYKCSGITSSGSGTITGSVNTYTLIMPAQNTEVSANTAAVEIKKIYFNNSYTLYGSVYAYVYNKDSSDNHTYEYLGPRPGKTMTKLDNSNIWYIEVPNDVDYVEFISGDGKTTGEMKIPWPNSGESPTYTYPKYTAPYNYDAPTIANGGTWGDYIWGSTNKRSNEYTVSDGTTMSNPDLFTGISATMYDYYTNGEIAASAGTASDTGASGAPNGWLKGIANNEYDPGTSGNLWLPYEDLNGALIGYADTTSQPKYDVTYPLYFGNLNYATKEGYYHYSQKANNSVPLTYSSNAVTGLSGKTLANGSIHYYDADDTTNENGAPMAMFNEDFLSGENSKGKPLATILRTSSFPVRKTTSAAGYHKIYFDASSVSWWNNDNVTTKAHFWDFTNPSDTLDVVMTQDQTNKFIYSTDRVDSKYDKVIFYRGSWNNQTNDLNVPAVTDTNLCYKLNNIFYGDNNKYCYGSWTTNSDAVYYNASHDYYEFDSTNGKDNAYITDINKSDKTAKINYYNDSYKTKTGAGAGDPYGFFPFDYNTYQNNANNSSNIAHDLGFGMKLEIPFTLEANGKFSNNDPQEFNFSGDDDLWVFVDGKLVLDLGGAHGRTTGTINFNTKKITYTMTESIGSATRNDDFTWFDNTNPNYVHTMNIYYMERGMFDSNLKFGFSFHAIPNQFWIDKKIRTKDIINAGFYVDNEQTGDASNKDATLTNREGRFISKFEASYQNENFTVAHKVGDTQNGTFSPAANLEYTIDNDTTTHNTGSEGTYPIKHDLGNAFIGKFTTGKYFNLTETFGNNKYVYTPAFSVWDQANNNQAITASGDNTSGYTFHFNPTTTVKTGIENTNIKARFENFMDAHTLTLTKELTNTVDPNATFTLQVLFDFENDNNYIAYPLYCDLDGVRTQLSNTGTIDIKAGQILEIEEIPQNAKIKVQEVLTDTVSGYRYDGISVKNGTSPIHPAPTLVTKGAQFTMGDHNATVTFSNKKPDNRYTIKYTYKSYDNLYGNQSYTVTGVFTKSELDTYMQLNASSGALEFKTEALKKTFINSKSPYEDNFQETVLFANADISNESWSNGNYTAEATAKISTNNKISVYFDLPYAVDSNLVPTEADTTNHRVAMILNQAVGSKKINCFDWYVTGGPSNNATKESGGGTPVYVKAPLMLYTNVSNTSTIQYFQYWSVKKLSSYGMKAAEYTRCYDYEFNLSLFMDCIIEPVYGDSWAQSSGNPNPPTTYNNYKRFDPEIQITGDTTKGISIAFLENSRNQWNNDDGGTKTGLAADTIYSDFLLSFNKVAGITQLNQLPAGTKNAGIVIEAVNYLDGSNAEGFNGSKDYSSVCSDTEDTQSAKIKSWLESGTKPSGINSVNKSQFDVTKSDSNKGLDNKNCIQYYTSIKNRNVDNSSGNLLNTNNNRYRVFRAYAYIGDVVKNNGNIVYNDSGTNKDIKLSNVTLSQPVYFTIYDIGKLHDLADNKS